MPPLKSEARSESLKALAFFRFSAAHLLPFVTLGYTNARLVLDDRLLICASLHSWPLGCLPAVARNMTEYATDVKEDLLIIDELAEQLTLNQLVEGSSPSRGTNPNRVLSGIFRLK